MKREGEGVRKGENGSASETRGCYKPTTEAELYPFLGQLLDVNYTSYNHFQLFLFFNL